VAGKLTKRSGRVKLAALALALDRGRRRAETAAAEEITRTPEAFLNGRGCDRDVPSLSGAVEAPLQNDRVRPPSLRMLCPVMYPDSGDSRNAATRAISSGSATRSIGIALRNFSATG